MSSRVVLLAFSFSCFIFASTEAYDPLDPNGNITIKTDVINWTPDGYVAVVTIYNYQKHRRIEAPGWIMGWTWFEKEVIWNIMGSETLEKGHCLRFNGSDVPESCTKYPKFVDLSPSAVENAVSSFQITVGEAGNTNRTVRLPKNYTFNAPGGGYTCGPAKVVKPTLFITPDLRRVTIAMMTWNVTCTYSKFLAYRDSPESIALAPAPDLSPVASIADSLSPAPPPSSSSCSLSFSLFISLVVNVFLCCFQPAI